MLLAESQARAGPKALPGRCQVSIVDRMHSPRGMTLGQGGAWGVAPSVVAMFADCVNDGCFCRATLTSFLDDPDTRRLLVFSDGKDLFAVSEQKRQVRTGGWSGSRARAACKAFRRAACILFMAWHGPMMLPRVPLLSLNSCMHALHAACLPSRPSHCRSSSARQCILSRASQPKLTMTTSIKR